MPTTGAFTTFSGRCWALRSVAQIVARATTDPLPNLRDLAPAVRQVFPEPAYRVGCGGAHIWLARANDPQRLALT